MLFVLQINHTNCSQKIKLELNFPKNFILRRRSQNALKINELSELQRLRADWNH